MREPSDEAAWWGRVLDHRGWRSPWTTGGAPAAVFVVLALLQWGFTIDDAFIVARYGRNLAQGHGWSFNPGEPIEGTTTILWTLVAWLSEAVGWGGAALQKAAGLGFGLLSVAWLGAVGLPGTRPFGRFLSALVLAAWIPHSLWSVAGLETSAAGTLGLLGVAGAGSRSSRWVLWGASALALGFLARPDLGLFWAVLLLVPALRWVWEGERPTGPAVASILLVTMVLAATTLWRHFTFGELLPNTAVTKAAIPLGRALGQGGPLLGHWLAFQLFGAVVLAAALGASQKRAELVAAGVVCSLTIAYVVSLGHPQMSMAYRFYVPVAPLVAALAAVGYTRFERSWLRRGVAFLLFLPVLAAPWAYRSLWFGTEPHFGSFYSFSERVAGMEEAVRFAKEIDRLLKPTVVIAISDAGAIPYYAPRRVVDLYGLNDREIAEAISRMKTAVDDTELTRRQQEYADVVHRREPDIFVDTFIAEAIWRDPRWGCYRRMQLARRYWFNQRAGAELGLWGRVCPKTGGGGH